MSKVENFVPFEPLNIFMSKLDHVGLGCGCNVQETFGDVDSGEIPVINEPAKEDTRILTAKQAIEKAFESITGIESCEVNPVKDALELTTPTKPIPGSVEVSNAVIDQVVEKILAKMKGKVAIIQDQDTVGCGCLAKGATVNYLVVEDEEKPADNTKTEATEATEDPYKDLPDTAKDGVIEDLVGVIEVAPQN